MPSFYWVNHCVIESWRVAVCRRKTQCCDPLTSVQLGENKCYLITWLLLILCVWIRDKHRERQTFFIPFIRESIFLRQSLSMLVFLNIAQLLFHEHRCFIILPLIFHLSLLSVARWVFKRFCVFMDVLEDSWPRLYGRSS